MVKIMIVVTLFCFIFSGCSQSSNNDTQVLYSIENDVFYYEFNEATFQTRLFLEDIISISEGNSKKSIDFLRGEMESFSSSDNFVLSKVLDPIKNRKDSLIINPLLIDPMSNIIALEKNYIKYISQNINTILDGTDEKVTLKSISEVIIITEEVNLSKNAIKDLDPNKYLKQLEDFINAVKI